MWQYRVITLAGVQDVHVPTAAEHGRAAVLVTAVAHGRRDWRCTGL